MAVSADRRNIPQIVGDCVVVSSGEEATGGVRSRPCFGGSWKCAGGVEHCGRGPPGRSWPERADNWSRAMTYRHGEVTGFVPTRELLDVR